MNELANQKGGSIRMKPILVCFGSLEMVQQYEHKYCVVAGSNVKTTYLDLQRAILQGNNSNRVYVISDAEASRVAWAFASRYCDMISAMTVLGGAAMPESPEHLRFTPILLRGDAADSPDGIHARLVGRFLKSCGNMDVSLCDALTLEEALSWMDGKSIVDRQEINWLGNGVWNINTGLIDSFYLVEGRDKALVIDTGMGRKTIKPTLERLTRLPMELALTHVHGDHSYHADEFDKVYMSPQDIQLLPVFVESMMPEKLYTADMFTEITDGSLLDLGDVKIEAIALPGHTPGSLVYADHTHKMIFCGDAFGSGIGVLMAIPGALPLEQYLKELIRFRARILPYKDYCFYGGHRIEEKGLHREKNLYNPLCVELLEDMIVLCRRLLTGERVEYEIQSSEHVPGRVIYATYHRASIWIEEDKLLQSSAKFLANS